MPLHLINFRKFITGDEKWALYDKRRKFKRKSWIDLDQLSISIAKSNIHTKNAKIKKKAPNSFAHLIHYSHREQIVMRK